MEPDFFSPDKNRLDEELVKQPAFYYEYAEKLAEARRDHEQADANKDLTYAELSKDIRSDPAGHGLDKITEDAVKQTIIASKRFQRAVAELIDAKYRMDELQAAVVALDHRKRAIEKLVDLHLANYFAKPSVPSGERERAEGDMKKEARTAGQRKQKRRELPDDDD